MILVSILAMSLAQTPAPTARLEFEAASIKPNRSGMRGWSMPPPSHGSVNFKNVTLKLLVIEAYQIQEFQLAGGPSWLDSEKYDITAKSSGASRSQVNQMLQALLADRFGLAVHRETKDLPFYAITIAKNGPKHGPTMHPAEAGDCPDQSTPDHPCGGFNVRNRSHLHGERVSLRQLAEVLSFILNRTVLDQTGLKGNFDMQLDWTPDDGQFRGAERPDAAPVDASGPTVYTALQEQAGLKLESRRGPVEILVIDRAEKATEN